MEIIKTVAEMSRWVQEQRTKGHTLALVPTMGFFHEGHLSLMRRAGELVDRVIVSLFVNPSQFAAHEDLDAYPRAFARDAALAEAEGVAVLFCPEVDDIYPPGFQTTVAVSELTSKLCGKSRPHHFAGVTTVVAKLFNIVAPQYAVFGEKDFQQLAVIRRMVRDLNMQVSLVGHAIVREKDGLAISSRNAYLSKAERRQALCLWHALQEAKALVQAGERHSGRVAKRVRDVLLAHGPCQIDYIELVNRDTLERSSTIDHRVLLALAVRIGTTRLIDNACLLHGGDKNV